MTEIAQAIKAPVIVSETPPPRTLAELETDSARIETALSPDPRFAGVREREEQQALEIFEAVLSGSKSKEEGARMVANRQTEQLLGAGEDWLTDLKARQGFEDAMTVGINLDRRNGKTTTLLYMDLDGFKAANDAAGHKFGDQVLIAVGGIINEQLTRASDVAARLGGDEYAIGMPNSNLGKTDEIAINIIDNIPSAVDEMAEIAEVGLSEVVTGSAGVIQRKHEALDDRPTSVILQEMIAEADEAMRVAKLLGKNRVINRWVNSSGKLLFQDARTKTNYEPIRNPKGEIIEAKPVEE